MQHGDNANNHWDVIIIQSTKRLNFNLSLQWTRLLSHTLANHIVHLSPISALPQSVLCN